MLQIAAPDCPVCTFYALLEQNNCALARCIIWGEWIIRCGFRGISKGMGFKVWVSISAWVIFLISQARERVCRLIDLLRCMHLRGKPNICITFPCSHINPSLICGCECVKIVFAWIENIMVLNIEYLIVKLYKQYPWRTCAWNPFNVGLFKFGSIF